MRPIGRFIYFIAWPVWVVYFKITPPRSKVFVTLKGKALLVKGWLGSNYWSLPGGGSHRGEDPKEAARRELLEEVGIDASVDDLVLLGKDRFYRNAILSDVVFFKLNLSSQPKIKLQKLEISDYIWVDINKLDEYKLTLQTRRALNLFESKLSQ